MLGSQLISPMYEKAGRSQPTHAARLVPIYSLTKGITEKQIRFLISQVVHYIDEIVDWLPDDVRDVADVMGLGEAIKAIHFPENKQEIAINIAARQAKNYKKFEF